MIYIFNNIKNVATLISLFLIYPISASAHEVYVLSPETIETLKNQAPVPLIDIFLANTNATIIWASVIGFVIISVFLVSISATMENKFDKYLVKLKHFAPFIARVTVGLAFISCAYHAALFGPELPFTSVFGNNVELMQVIFTALGIFMIFGLYSRVAGLAGLAIFAFGVFSHGTYMFTYLNYFTEFLVLILVGGHKFAAAHEKPVWWNISDDLNYLSNKFGEFSFFILRIGFGASLIFSSVYAKIYHNQLAIAVVTESGLDKVFGMPAEFIVFGAALIEILLGLFFLLGIEIRFNAIVINVFLTLSLIYFGESVWPHIILIGIPIAFFCYGYDKYSLEGYFFKKGNREPIF